MKHPVKKLWIGVLICCSLFILGNLMTVAPHQTSGNGNPAFLMAAALIMTAPFMIFFIVNVLIRYDVSKKWMLRLLVIGMADFCFGYFYQLNQSVSIRKTIGQRMLAADAIRDMDYVNSALSGYSIYLNAYYFSFNTLLMFFSCLLMVSVLLYGIYRLFRRPPEEQKSPSLY